MPPDRITWAAMRRRGRFGSAVRTTRKVVQRGWSGEHIMGPFEVETPDEELARELDLRIRERQRTRETARGLRTFPEYTLVLPPWLRKTPGTDGRKGGSVLYERVSQYLSCCGGYHRSHGLQFSRAPDEVIARIIESDREVYVHSYLDRTSQRMWLDALTPSIEQTLGDNVHGYRPGRSRFTGLSAASHLIRGGYRYVATQDVRRMFPSIRSRIVEETLRRTLPHVSNRMRAHPLWWMTNKIYHAPEHPDFQRSPWCHADHLLTGSVIAPSLANLVLHLYLDEPVRRSFPDVIMLRYADDLLLLGQTASVVENAVHALPKFLAPAGLKIHPDKGFAEPRDVFAAPVTWLGKQLLGGRVRTPDAEVERLIGATMRLAPETAEFATAVRALLTELAVDRPKRIERVRRRFRGAARTGFEQVAGTWSRAKAVKTPPDPEDFGEQHQQKGKERRSGTKRPQDTRRTHR